VPNVLRSGKKVLIVFRFFRGNIASAKCLLTGGCCRAVQKRRKPVSKNLVDLKRVVDLHPVNEAKSNVGGKGC